MYSCIRGGAMIYSIEAGISKILPRLLTPNLLMAGVAAKRDGSFAAIGISDHQIDLEGIQPALHTFDRGIK